MTYRMNLSNTSFLVVDDNAHMISIIKTLLKGFGVTRIFEAAEATEGFEEFRINNVDVIILDYAMDTLDGIEFTQLVRSAQDCPNPYVPIVMLTAYAERRLVERARDAGVTEFLRKPICATDLYRRVVQVLQHPRPFVRTNEYFGPDRRRKEDPMFKGPERRDNSFDLDGVDVDDDPFGLQPVFT